MKMLCRNSQSCHPEPFIALWTQLTIVIPALDGGRLFFMFIELIIRRPIPQKFEKWVHAVGMILLLAFMAVISFKDIVSLIRG